MNRLSTPIKGLSKHLNSKHLNDVQTHLYSTCLLCLFISGCTVGPEYERPQFKTPLHYKAPISATDDSINTPLSLDNWWQLFQDTTLSQLIKQAEINNLDLAIALARIDQAAAIAGISRTDLFPEIDFSVSGERSRRSINNGSNNQGRRTRNQFETSFDISYEVDLWGRIHRLHTSDLLEAEAQRRAYDFALLSLQTNVAERYFEIRALDEEIDLLQRTAVGRKEALDIIRKRFDSGLSSELDITQADAEWAQARAALQSRKRSRSENENALAVLLGQTASEFSISPKPTLSLKSPNIPLFLPSELLLRRPDIAEAERLMAAASERIGANQAEYYPRIQLTGNVGYQSSELNKLITTSANFAELGPSLSLPIFDRRRIGKRVQQAEAEFAELQNRYRKQILTAFQEIENAQTNINLLDQEIEAQKQAVNSYQQASRLSRQRFDQGLVDYFEVVDIERAGLTSAQTLSRLKGERLIESIRLIRALGGGWTAPIKTL